jgi:hypothetical protein
MNAPAVTSDIVIVQLQHLFVIPSRLGEAEESHVFAYVFYGKRDGVDTRTQCPFYSFSADANLRKNRHHVIKAQRLRTYIHFGLINGKMALNRFFMY